MPPFQMAGSPANQDGSGAESHLEHDLPLEIFQQGWRKCWSKRENRFYFWNKATGESLWDMPPNRSNVNY